jgi:uncharacterized C2H2 Zn-finger protein
MSRGWWAMEGYFPDHTDGPWKLCFDPPQPGWPQLFRTRRECREYIEKVHGYVRERDDLKRMGFRLPRAVRVAIVKELLP